MSAPAAVARVGARRMAAGVTLAVTILLAAAGCGTAGTNRAADGAPAGASSPPVAQPASQPAGPAGQTARPPSAITSAAAQPARTEQQAPTSQQQQPPASRAGRSFDIGAEFQARCTVAWPTAPQVSTVGILMRMTCSGVPDTYQFVDVSYGDPTLAVTPSTGAMTVHGQVVDHAQSGYGFAVLVVVADRVTL